MGAAFPSDGMGLTHIPVVADTARARTFYRQGSEANEAAG